MAQERAAARSLPAARISTVSRAAIVAFALAGIAFSAHLRWSLASVTLWHCDELPLLARFTALGGAATSEAEALEFKPSLYSLRQGALRSLRVPDFQYSAHTTTGFWTNLSLHLFGYGLLAGRAMPLLFSLLAVLASAWAVRLAGGGILGATLAAVFVALSPCNVVYGAQARGYAEAMALAPALVAMIEWYRRRPDAWVRAALVGVCAIQLSLTVYTAWTYWALPCLVAACILAPRGLANKETGRFVRTTLMATLVTVTLMMSLYTAERFRQLHLLSVAFGDHVGNWAEAMSYVAELLGELLPAPAWLGVIGCVGAVPLLRGQARWWMWLFAAGIAIPALLAAFTGSAGYKRNLVHLLAPIAILFGLGSEWLIERIASRWRREWTLAAAAVVVAGVTTWSAASLPTRCERLLLPDWGAIAREYAAIPTRFGPRWFCPCLANHWQINWYQAKPDMAAMVHASMGATIEVVLGAQIGDDGRPKVYRHNPSRGAILESAIPEFIAKAVPTGVRHGVEMREWTGTRVTLDDVAGASVALVEANGAGNDPVLVFAVRREAISAEAWNRFLVEGGAGEAGLVAFKESVSPVGVIQSMIVPADRLRELVGAMCRILKLDEADMAFYRLDTAPSINALPLVVRQFQSEQSRDRKGAVFSAFGT